MRGREELGTGRLAGLSWTFDMSTVCRLQRAACLAGLLLDILTQLVDATWLTAADESQHFAGDLCVTDTVTIS
jgi:hypothetical protein